jgi:mannose-6-phosphate isomerase-like protein (cupin superfamily)
VLVGDFTMSPTEILVIELDSKTQFQKLLQGRPQTCGMRSGRVYLQPGESCGQHSTNDREEMLIFLSGNGLLLVGEEENSFEVGQGKVAYIPPQIIHNIENTGIEPLVYIYCVNPLAGA